MRKAVYSIFVALFLFNLQPIYSFQPFQIDWQQDLVSGYRDFNNKQNTAFKRLSTLPDPSCIEPCQGKGCRSYDCKRKEDLCHQRKICKKIDLMMNSCSEPCKGCEESGHYGLCMEKRSECGRNGECFLISLINSCNDACKHCMNEAVCGDVEQQCASWGVPISCDYKPFRDTCIGACSGCTSQDIACIEKHNECHKNIYKGCSTAKLTSNCYEECTNCTTEEQCAYTERHCRSLVPRISCDNWKPFRGTCLGACSRSGCKRKDIACNQKRIECECARDKLEINCAEECAKCMTEEQCAETERQCASLGIRVSCNNWKPIFETCILLTCAGSTCDLRRQDIANVLESAPPFYRYRDALDVACIEKQEECERNGECLSREVSTICYEQCAKCVTEEQRAYTEDRCESLGITVSCPVYESCMEPCNKKCGPKDSKCLQKKMECERYGMCTHNHINSINACKNKCKYCMNETQCIAAEQQCKSLGVTISCAISHPPSAEECIEPCFGCNHGNMTCYQKKEECRLTGVCDQVNSCATNCKQCETHNKYACSAAEEQCKLLGIAISCGSPPDCSVACIQCLPGDSICYQKRSECDEKRCDQYRSCKNRCDQWCIFAGSIECSRAKIACSMTSWGKISTKLQDYRFKLPLKRYQSSNQYPTMECEPILCPQACYYCQYGDILCYQKRNQCEQFFEQNIAGNSIVNPSGCAWFLQYLSTPSPVQRTQSKQRGRPLQPLQPPERPERPQRPRRPRPQRPRQRGMAEIIDLDKDNNEVIGGVDAIHLNSGLVTIELSKLTLYVLIVVMILLLINILCLVYINYTEKRRGDKKIEYSRINVASSSDDDMENLNEVEIE